MRRLIAYGIGVVIDLPIRNGILTAFLKLKHCPNAALPNPRPICKPQ